VGARRPVSRRRRPPVAEQREASFRASEAWTGGPAASNVRAAAAPAIPDPALGSAIRLRRRARGETLESLAFSTGLSAKTIGSIELAKSNPTWFNVKKIATALELSLVELAQAVEGRAEGVAG